MGWFRWSSAASRRGSVPPIVLTYPLQDWGSHFGPLGRPSSRILAEALAYLRSERQPRWDMLDLRWIPEPEIEAVESAMRGLRWNPHRGVWKLSNVADLPTTLAAYLAERPPKWRGELLRNRRRVMRVGRMEIEHYRPSRRRGRARGSRSTGRVRGLSAGRPP